ncbi:MAG: PQQ-binding-like beta-propeller repeat protein [Ignavibacterium sp.]|nr:PQQ-binding-like beta-propeller repeat protein [Ignavibacterium sp.]
MKVQFLISMFIVLLLFFNKTISAYHQTYNLTIIDSIIHIQDTVLQKVWEINSGSFSSSRILNNSNWIYSISDSGLVTCYDFNGNQKWITEILGTTTNNSALYKDLLLIATVEGDLYSINSNNGEILQVVGIGENITSDPTLIEISTAALKAISVVLGTSEGNIFCYDAFSFELLWQKKISTSQIISSPLIEKDKVVILNDDFSIYCVNSKSGSLIWKYEFSVEQNFSAKNFPVSDGKYIFSLSTDEKIFALDILLGKKIWSSNTKGVLNQFYIIPDSHELFLINDKGMMTIYSTKNGKEINKIDFKKSELFSFIIAEDRENTLVGFSDGSLLMFDSKFVSKELISANQIPIISLNIISKNEFIVKDINGKITFYKIN